MSTAQQNGLSQSDATASRMAQCGQIVSQQQLYNIILLFFFNVRIFNVLMSILILLLGGNSYIYEVCIHCAD